MEFEAEQGSSGKLERAVWEEERGKKRTHSSTGNSTQCSVMTSVGRKSFKKLIYAYIELIHFVTQQKLLYFNVKKKKKEDGRTPELVHRKQEGAPCCALAPRLPW